MCRIATLVEFGVSCTTIGRLWCTNEDWKINTGITAAAFSSEPKNVFSFLFKINETELRIKLYFLTITNKKFFVRVRGGAREINDNTKAIIVMSNYE